MAMTTMKLVAFIMGGCLLSCCLTTLVNNFQYGNSVVKLNKKSDDYGDDIPKGDTVSVNMTTSLKWNIIPSIVNLFVWGALIMFLTRKSSSDTDTI